MRIDILTLFPDTMRAMLGESILGRAQARGLLDIRCHQIRDYTENRQKQVDDYPYGGGWGQVMMAQPLKSCLDAALADSTVPKARRRVIYLSPQGATFTQAKARQLKADYDQLVLVCGHYEGVDERFIEACVDEELSIGDFVLTGGELGAMVVTDCVCRMVPGVLSDTECYTGESHWAGRLEYPQYTRPETWEDRAVPEVLLGGDHAKIDAWRGEQSRTRTRLRRPELYEQWCTSHPIAEVPKWKRGENVRLVKTAEQFAAAAKLFAEGRQAVCADNWTPEYCRTLTEPQFLLQLQQEKAAGWVCYLHTTKDVPDGMVCVSHKAGHIEHLFVTEKARGNGIGAKLLDFARKKLPEHAHPVLSVLNTNTRAIALYTRMGWQLDGSTSLEFDPKQYSTVTRKCALVQMRYAGPAQE